MHPLARLDHRYLWHPFTQMRDWLKHEPIVIAKGSGPWLLDVKGRRYLDANSSIWTNLHGHRHPAINRAIRAQLDKIAHSSALGFANEPASRLGERLVRAANPPSIRPPAANPALRNPALTRVFYSDDGSTAMEVALKLCYEFARRTRGDRRPRFLSLDGAYHGDTVGAVSLGHIDLFHKAYSGLLFPTDKVPAPYCYRCPFNRARPESADAREYRKCHWECVDAVEKRFLSRRRRGGHYAGFVFEPRMQGAAGMVAQPDGWLRRTAEIARQHGACLVADEVMTGLGRTGPGNRPSSPLLFACHHEGVQPDFLAMAKGLSGGYLPLAATLTTNAVFDAFLGEYEEFKTFFHGHSFTANQLGTAAALASLDLLNEPATVAAQHALQRALTVGLSALWDLESVGDIRQVGTVAGVELVRHRSTRRPFPLREKVGIRVCEAMARRGVLTRPVGNVIVLMPPYCTTPRQCAQILGALYDSIAEVVAGKQ